MKIFAYGSNMSLKRLKKRVPSASIIENGYIKGYVIKCIKCSKDGSGKATVIKTDKLEDRVWGVIFEIDENEKYSLDKAEGLGYGYNEEKIDVTLSRKKCRAQIYVADGQVINEEMVPYHWYKAFILSGAKESNLPEDYINKLENIKSVQDKNEKRRRENCSILNG